MYDSESKFITRSNPAGDAFGVSGLKIATPPRGGSIPATEVTIYGYEAGNSTPVVTKSGVDVADDNGIEIDLTAGTTGIGSFSNIVRFRIKQNGDYFVVMSVTFVPTEDSDATLTAAGTVPEPLGLYATANNVENGRTPGRER